MAESSEIAQSAPNSGGGGKISRRAALGGAAAAAATVVWRDVLHGLDWSSQAADVDARAERLEARQVVPTDPPPLRWEPGWFINRVIPDEGQKMALTFDDGPSPYNTPPILQALADENVKATFFVIGVNVRAWPDIARAIVDEGHEIGNHSVYHTPYRSYDLSLQIGPNQEIIAAETGVVPVANRTPGFLEGEPVLEACLQHGLYEVHTHMSTFDWISPRYESWELYWQFVNYHRNGAFAAYHDGGSPRPTPDAMPSIIEYAKSVGYQLMTASELIARGTPLPGWMSYENRDVATLEATTDASAEPTPRGDEYDARAVFEARLDDPTVKRAERSRIVEILAEMDDAAAAG